MLAYAFAIFSGAFLLFEVEPLIAKYILPWFGGGPGVWTTCLLFFQVALLAGYAYAHAASRWFKLRTQVIVHLSLLAAALALLPITPSAAWKPKPETNPTFQILALLAANLGLSYCLLAATSPLLQAWLSRTHPAASPYRFYALSNIGSLLALVTYPSLVEPHFSRSAQAKLWMAGLVLFALSSTLCALLVWRRGMAGSPLQGNPKPPSVATPRSGVHPLTRVLWVLLPGCASVLLMAITNKLCQDVASVPFLWVAPLALYLLSFVICFDSPRWYVRFPFTIALVTALGAICWALFHGSDFSTLQQLGIYAGGLFICCMVCHGELYRLRPGPEHLTLFYLSIACGGALGGIFVALLAPLLFNDYYELNLGLWCCAALFLVVCLAERGQTRGLVGEVEQSRGHRKGLSPTTDPDTRRQWRRVLKSIIDPRMQWPLIACTLPLFLFAALDRFFAWFGQDAGQAPSRGVTVLRMAVWALLILLGTSWVARGKFKGFKHWRGLACAWMALGLLGLGVTLWLQGIKSGGGVVYMSRNFYGVLTLYDYQQQEPKAHHLLLRHGRITHGFQFLDPEQARWPTAYYGEDSGVGLAIRALGPGQHRLGLVGLGAGTLAAYLRPGDEARIYEINPAVVEVASNRFSFLRRSAGKIQIELGDARLSLEREPPQEFDLLVLDAFNSDSIPVHLLTREAFELYRRHLRVGGVIAVHLSNHYLNLEPVVANVAHEFHYQLRMIDYEANEEQWWLYPSTWALLSYNTTLMNSPAILASARPPATNKAQVPVWTDDFTSLYQLLKR